MSSGRKRRVHAENPVALTLDRSVWVRIMLYLLFAAGVGVMVLKSASLTNFADDPLRGALFGFVIAATAVAVVQANYDIVNQRNGRILLVFGGLAGHIALVRGISFMVDANQMPGEMKFLLIPFALMPMVHAVLLGRGIGTFSTVFAALLGSLVMPKAGRAALHGGQPGLRAGGGAGGPQGPQARPTAAGRGVFRGGSAAAVRDVRDGST